jgi:hypothetical protein
VTAVQGTKVMASESPLYKQGLVFECASLEKRLIEGYCRIEEAIQAGENVTGWERFWIELLHRYEAACMSLDDEVA